MRGVRAAAAAAAAGVLAALALAAPASGHRAVWLCRPGLAHDPCRPGLSTTVFSPSGKRLLVRRHPRVRRRTIDCFYVYPTVSDQPGGQATLRIDPEERSIALYQAARYWGACRVYAPMYRQITLRAITGAAPVTARMRARAYADVRDAWRTFLRR